MNIRIMVSCDVALHSLIDIHHHFERTCREDGTHQVAPTMVPVYPVTWRDTPDGKWVSSLHMERKVSWIMHIIIV
jgi:hypothetical protein